MTSLAVPSGTSHGSAAGGNGSSTDGRYPRRDSRNECNLGFREALPYPELESGLETVEA